MPSAVATSGMLDNFEDSGNRESLVGRFVLVRVPRKNYPGCKEHRHSRRARKSVKGENSR